MSGGVFRTAPGVVAAGVLLAAAAWLASPLAATGQDAQRIAVLLLLAPVLEETVFRAGVQEFLQRRWPLHSWLPIGVTALAFGAAHALARADSVAFAVALPALLIGAVYRRTGRLRHCILLHAAMNAAWLVAFQGIR